ncbi:hypothetical protein JXB02_01985 [Candidatus Woesearchaeota archaeon]|nr:hypothetical protein [Candidatus Woesearchaeota archaeon]
MTDDTTNSLVEKLDSTGWGAKTLYYAQKLALPVVILGATVLSSCGSKKGFDNVPDLDDYDMEFDFTAGMPAEQTGFDAVYKGQIGNVEVTVLEGSVHNGKKHHVLAWGHIKQPESYRIAPKYMPWGLGDKRTRMETVEKVFVADQDTSDDHLDRLVAVGPVMMDLNAKHPSLQKGGFFYEAFKKGLRAPADQKTAKMAQFYADMKKR